MTTSTQTQIRRGTAAQCDASTPASSELWHDTTNNSIRAGDGSRAGGWRLPNFSEIQKQTFTGGTIGGTADALTLTNNVPIIAYVQNLKQVFKASSNNTTAMTVNVDGKGAKDIKKIKSGALAAMEADDVIAGGLYEITYDGTQFQIKGLSEANDSTTGSVLLAIVTGGGSSYDFTSLIDSTYDNYELVLKKILPSASTAILNLRIRPSAGSFQTSGYRWSNTYNSSGSTVSPEKSESGSGLQLCSTAQGMVSTASGGQGMSGKIDCYALAQSGYASFGWKTQSLNTAGSPYLVGVNGDGFYAGTTGIDGLRLVFSSGNIASGTAYLYGKRSSLS